MKVLQKTAPGSDILRLSPQVKKWKGIENDHSSTAGHERCGKKGLLQHMHLIWVASKLCFDLCQTNTSVHNLHFLGAGRGIRMLICVCYMNTDGLIRV